MSSIEKEITKHKKSIEEETTKLEKLENDLENMEKKESEISKTDIELSKKINETSIEKDPELWNAYNKQHMIVLKQVDVIGDIVHKLEMKIIKAEAEIKKHKKELNKLMLGRANVAESLLGLTRGTEEGKEKSTYVIPKEVLSEIADKITGPTEKTLNKKKETDQQKEAREKRYTELYKKSLAAVAERPKEGGKKTRRRTRRRSTKRN
jgi:hypothetical protein